MSQLLIVLAVSAVILLVGVPVALIIIRRKIKEMGRVTSDRSPASRSDQETPMKAVVYHKYGTPDELNIEEIPKPPPKDDEVLIKVHAASVNAADWHILRGKPFPLRFFFGLFAPKHRTLGADVAGWVEAVGSNVTAFQPGDEVFGDLSDCGFGGFAEYVCAPAAAVLSKPTNVTFEQAAAVPLAGLTALQALRDHGRIRSGQKVLVNGASGGVGTYAVQIAKSFGTEVTGVCSTTKLDMVRSMGADHVIDYTQKNFTQNGQRYDLIIAANGFHPISAYKRVLSPKGTYVATGGTGAQIFQAMVLGPWMSMFGSKKMKSMGAKTNPQDLATLKELLEGGAIVPEIDRRYPLNETADAFRYLGDGHARGKVIITM